MPRLAKVQSQWAADAYLRAGWVLKHAFYAEGDDEPYEYILEWLEAGDPVRPAIFGDAPEK